LAEYYETEGRESRLRIRLPKGSYVAQIEERAQSAALPAKAPKRASSAVRAAAVAAIALTVGLAAALTLRSLHPPVRARTVVVLPFRDLSSDSRLGHIGEGLREGLTSALVRTKGIEVMARASWPKLARAANPADAAKAAQAEAAVTGSVGSDGDRLQIVVSLADAGTGKYLWSQTYQGKVADLSAIGHSAVLGIARALGASSNVPDNAPAQWLPRNSEVLELYLRASALARTREAARMREAAALFERVIALEPDFALGYAGAAANYLVAVNNGCVSWRDGGPRGVGLARKAVALDPTLAEAHSALGLALESEWEWREAGAELSRAIDLDPRYAAGYFRKARDLAIVGRFAEAERKLETARMLDPSWEAPDGLLGELYYYTRRWDDALGLARRGREAQPSYASFFGNLAARVYIARGQTQLAGPYLSADPDAFHRAWVRAIDGDPRGGWRDLLVTRQTSGESAFHLAEFAAAALRDPGTALDWLEQSFRDHEPDLVSLMLDPIFDSIREDPRARAIRRGINLAEWPVWYAEN
jgi:TolB-like protein